MTNAEKLAIKGQIKDLKKVVANLESLLVEETVVEQKPVEQKPVIKYMSPDEITVLANALIVKSGLEYEGKATMIQVSYATQMNEGFEVPYLNRNKLDIKILDGETVLASGIFNKNKFAEYFAQLAYLGVFSHNKDFKATVVNLNC